MNTNGLEVFIKKGLFDIRGGSFGIKRAFLIQNTFARLLSMCTLVPNRVESSILLVTLEV